MQPKRRPWWPIVKLLIGVAILFYVARRFALDLSQPELYEQPIAPGWLVASGALYLAGIGVPCLYWGWLLARLGPRPSLLPLARAYYVGQFGKYVPGKALSLFMRASYARSAGAAPGVAGMTAFYEVLVTMGSGALLATIFYAALTWQAPPITGREAWSQAWYALVHGQEPEGGFAPRALRIVAASLAVGVLWPTAPPVFNRLAHRVSLPFRDPADVLPRIRLSHLVFGLILGTAGWLLLGLALACALHGAAVGLPSDALTLAHLTAVLAVGWVAGFVVLVAPGGLGARELMLTWLLTPEVAAAHDLPHQLAAGKVALIVLLMRLAWTAAEVFAALALLRLPREVAVISIIIPVFNERESLLPLHAEIVTVMQQHRLAVEVLFIDDGSTDGSWDVIADLARRYDSVRGVRFRRNFGKAAALSAGFREAKGQMILTLDADLQDDPAELPRFLTALDEGGPGGKRLDVVSGWKRIRHDPWHKVLPSRVFNRLVSWMTGVPLHDHNCGMKCYRAEVFREVRLYGELHRFIPVLAAARGFTVGEIEINHRPRRYGRSKYGVRRFIKGFLDLLTVKFLTGFGQRPQHLLGTLGLISFLGGSAAMLYLLVTWFIRLWNEDLFAPLHQRPLLNYGLAALLLGAQMMSIGFLAELITAFQSREEDSYSIVEQTSHSPSSPGQNAVS